MSKFIDETGNKYGRLTVLKRIQNPRYRLATWQCKCDCGKIHIVAGAYLRSGNTKSCGCLKRDNLRKIASIVPGKAAFNEILASYKIAALRRNLLWELSDKQFQILTSKNCYYCGAPPQRSRRTRSSNGIYIYNGIDRMDNTQGYTITNSVPCCTRCNLAKKKLSHNEFLQWIKDIYYNRCSK